MMTKACAMTALCVLFLTACGDKAAQPVADNNATPMSQAQVKAAVDKVQLKPGQWEGSFTVQDIDLSKMPGAPAQMKDQMKRMMSQTSLKYCVTPEEAANPSGRMFSGQENKDCTYKGFAVAGGKVQGQISCASAGHSMNATMSGTYAADRYSMDMDMQMAGGPKGEAMAIKGRSAGKWIGDSCTGKP